MKIQRFGYLTRGTIFILVVCTYVGNVRAQTTRPAAEPTRISLKLDNATTAQALAAFTKATGIAVNRYHNQKDDARVTLAFENAPMMQVLAELVRQAKLQPVDMGNSHVLTFQNVEPALIINPDPTTLIIVNNIALDAQVAARDPNAKPRYAYTVTMSAHFDPSRQIIAVAGNPMMDELIFNTYKFRIASEGRIAIQKVDARPIGNFAFTYNINSTEPLDIATVMKLRLRAWQSIERASVEVKGMAITKGASVEKDGLKLTTLPPAPDGTLHVRVSGDLMKSYMQPPWNYAITRGMYLEDVDGVITDIRCSYALRDAREGEIELQIGGDDPSNPNRAIVPPIPEDFEVIGISLPTKVRVIDIPITLTDIPMP